MGLSGGAWTALRMTQLVEMRQAAFRALMNESAATVVLCQWAKELLLRNGISAAKMSLSRHGLRQTIFGSDVAVAPHDLGAANGKKSQSLRLVFWGGLYFTKCQ